jgi:small conductance mechanosensitive channel
MDEEAENDRADRRWTIWVTPWDRCKRPTLPSGADRDEAFVLHTLLLHDGLPLEWQQQVLPLPPNHVIETLLLLEEAGLVAQHDATLIEPTFENLVAFLGALGVALGFAFKDYVSSLIAGVVTLYEMPYRPGDWIQVDGAYGEVKAINMRAAEIVTPDDTVVIVPHLKLWNQLIFNANDGGQNLMCIADFYLHPRHDAALVKHALHDVALTSAFLDLEQPIQVIVADKPWGTHYRLKAYPIEPRQQFHFTTDLTIRGKESLTRLGAEFAAMPPPPEASQ